MKLTVARTAGFCYGVRRAVDLAVGAAEQKNSCMMLGPIIHNEDVVRYLGSLGVGLADRPEDVPEGCTVILRSHGEGRAVHEALARRGIPVLDATCPNVSRIHRLVVEAEEEGRTAVIVGTPSHPEVQAIAGWCRSPVVAEGPEDLEKWLNSAPSRRDLPLTLVSQTTSTRELWDSVIEKAKKSVQI